MRKPTMLVLGVLAATAMAQAIAPLPPKLAGTWTYIGPRTFIDSVTLVFEDDGKSGTVKGRTTWRGVNCGTQDEPFTGTWDGTVLRFEAMHRPNVNAQRANGNCPETKSVYNLRRKPGQSGFEGEVQSGPVVATVSLSPQ
jgi:hypothetical protein